MFVYFKLKMNNVSMFNTDIYFKKYDIIVKNVCYRNKKIFLFDCDDNVYYESNSEIIKIYDINKFIFHVVKLIEKKNIVYLLNSVNDVYKFNIETRNKTMIQYYNIFDMIEIDTNPNLYFIERTGNIFKKNIYNFTDYEYNYYEKNNEYMIDKDSSQKNNSIDDILSNTINEYDVSYSKNDELDSFSLIDDESSSENDECYYKNNNEYIINNIQSLCDTSTQKNINHLNISIDDIFLYANNHVSDVSLQKNINHLNISINDVFLYADKHTFDEILDRILIFMNEKWMTNELLTNNSRNKFFCMEYSDSIVSVIYLRHSDNNLFIDDSNKPKFKEIKLLDVYNNNFVCVDHNNNIYIGNNRGFKKIYCCQNIFAIHAHFYQYYFITLSGIYCFSGLRDLKKISEIGNYLFYERVTLSKIKSVNHCI